MLLSSSLLAWAFIYLVAPGLSQHRESLLTRVASKEFGQWLQSIWPLAEQRGISRATFDRLTQRLSPDLSLPDLETNGSGSITAQEEFSKAPGDYLDEKYLRKLAARAMELRRQYRQLLRSIDVRFGTPPSLILAVWGRETAYGSYRLPHNAIRVLATQACVGRRKEFFEKEFMLGMQLVQDGHVLPEDMKSSWAGAMGHTQFLPSDFYRFAVDFDGDGRRDIWNSIPDSLASAAKQLVDYGWKGGNLWGWEVSFEKAFDCTQAALARPLKDWFAFGITPPSSDAANADLEAEASLLMPAGTLGPSFLTFGNYRAIKSYNYSDLYALFVATLADRIDNKLGFQTPWTSNSKFTRNDISKLQAVLATEGLYLGSVDGSLGPHTRLAVGKYQKQNGLTLTCWPTRQLLDHIESRRK